MPLIDRYLFRQILGPTVLATIALSVVAVLSEALSAIGLLLNERQSPLVFAKVVILAMPQLIVLILPIALLVAGLITINRLHRDHEIAVCFANGMSRWRVISPAIRLAALVAVMSLAISLWVQPLCYRALRDTLESARNDLLATMIRPGQFTHPAPGVTVYAQSVDDDGAIHNLFIDQRMSDGRETTIMASQGRLNRGPGAPMLVLRHGQNQQLSPTGPLIFLYFEQYSIDLQSLMNENSAVVYKSSDRYLHELFYPRLNSAWERANVGPMLAEAHSRLSAPLYNIAFMFLALEAIIGGGFSRFGYGARIAAAAAVAAVTRIGGIALQTASGGSPALNGLQYAAPILVSAICAGLLLHAGASNGAGRIPAADAPPRAT